MHRTEDNETTENLGYATFLLYIAGNRTMITCFCILGQWMQLVHNTCKYYLETNVRLCAKKDIESKALDSYIVPRLFACPVILGPASV